MKTKAFIFCGFLILAICTISIRASAMEDEIELPLRHYNSTQAQEDEFFDADHDGILDSFEDELIQTYAPILRFDVDDYIRPTSVDWYFQIASLRHAGVEYQGGPWDWVEIIIPSGRIRSGTDLLGFERYVTVGGDPPLTILEKSDSRDWGSHFFLDYSSENTSLRCGDFNTATIYAHVSRGADRGSYDITYHIFYPYNDDLCVASGTCGGSHEGDWEFVQFHVNTYFEWPVLSGVYLSAHGSESDWYNPGVTIAMANEEGEINNATGTHPIVYVARRSHANYPHMGTHERGGILPDDHSCVDDGINSNCETYYTWTGNWWTRYYGDDDDDDPNKTWGFTGIEDSSDIVNVGEYDFPAPGMEWINFSGRWGDAIDKDDNMLGYCSDCPGPYGPKFNPYANSVRTPTRPAIVTIPPDQWALEGEQKDFNFGHWDGSGQPSGNYDSLLLAVDWGDDSKTNMVFDEFSTDVNDNTMVNHTYSQKGRYFVNYEISGESYPVDSWNGGGFTVYVNSETPQLSLQPESPELLAVNGVPYSQVFSAETDDAGKPYVAILPEFTVSAGSLPTGLSLDQNGVLSGTPTELGTFEFSVHVQDAYDFTSDRAYTFVVIPPLSAGDRHTCRVMSDGQLKCWGIDSEGSVSGPNASTDLFSQVSAGSDNTCGLLMDVSGEGGNIICWGMNGWEQVSGPNASTEKFAQVSMGAQHTCALRADNSVDCWGSNINGQAPPHVPFPFKQVSAGGLHTCWLNSDDYLGCVGNNAFGQAPVYIDIAFDQVTTGYYHTCALLKANSEVWCWGLNTSGQALLYVPGPFIQISAGHGHTCGLTEDRNVECWGLNTSGQAPDFVPGPFLQIDAGRFHTCGLKPDGGVLCWGRNDDGQAPQLVIEPDWLPYIVGGQEYSQSFTVSAFNYDPSSPQFSIVAGSLPPGLSLNEDGTLSGTPPLTNTGVFEFTVRVRDAISFTGEKTYRLVPLVNSVDDHNDGICYTQDCTLREAIAAQAEGGTIDFDASLSGKTIELESTLTIDKDLTIDGTSLDQPITISGGGSVRVFTVKSGVTAKLDGLVIANGNADYGGGIWNGGTLTVANSTLNKNEATYGGGICNNFFSILTITGSTFSENNATAFGGGIHNAGTAEVKDSTLEGNTAGAFGGGIIGYSGTLTVTNSTFGSTDDDSSGNSAQNGGGIYNYGASKLTVTDSIFSNNEADVHGGGIHNEGIMEMTGSTLEGNTAVNFGGGVIGFSGTLTVMKSTFSDNRAQNGGGIYNYQFSELTVTGSTFSNNEAFVHGGGITNEGIMKMTNSTLVGNTANVFGGGVFGYSGMLTVTNSTFSGNSSKNNNGGGLANYGNSTLHLANTILMDSKSNWDCTNAGPLGTDVGNLIENNLGCGTSVWKGDPGLGPLQDNGGPTQTMAITAASPAFNEGNSEDNICPQTDQRGLKRPQAGACDIGAYELAENQVLQGAISVGGRHSCRLLDSEGANLICWGDDSDGQVSYPNARTERFVYVSAGGKHTCAILETYDPDEGNLLCWGMDSYGSVSGPNTSTDEFVQVDTGMIDFGAQHTCALRVDGSVLCWGYPGLGLTTPPSGTFAQISAGPRHNCGLRFDGSLACWGYDFYGAVSDPNASTEIFTQVSAGYGHSCALSADQEDNLTCWGLLQTGTLGNPPPGPFTQISAGTDYTCGLKDDGTVLCWGIIGSYGQAGYPSSGTFTQVSAGNRHTCALKSDGGVFCWGRNESGEAPWLSIDPESLAYAAVNKPYSQNLSASAENYEPPSPVFTLSEGTLPSGLSLDQNGALSGTPSEIGTFEFTVRVQDAIGFSAERTYELVVYSDEDNIPDEVEDNAPNNGDGNDDGTPDSQQGNVTSLPTAVEGEPYVTIESPGGTSLIGVTTDPAPSEPLGDIEFPLGVLSFGVEDVPEIEPFTVTLYVQPGRKINSFYKYGPTAEDETDHWYEFLYDGTTGAKISGNSDEGYTITLHLVDNGPGDSNPNVGEFNDPGAPVFIPDTTPPVINPSIEGALGDNGWYVSDVNVSWTVSDEESAVLYQDGCDETTIDYDTDNTTLSCTATSLGGTSSESVTLKRDVTPPTDVIGEPDRTPDHGDWYNQPLEVIFSGSDETSGVAACTTSTYCGPDSAAATVNGNCMDNAGNTSVDVPSVSFAYDTTPPVITYDSRTPPNAAGWNNTAVIVEWTCADDLSGPAAVIVSETLSGEGADQSVTGTCSDNAGNTTLDTQSGISIDLTPPTLDPTVSPDPVLLYGEATADANASDTLSGLAAQSCETPDTSTVGEKSLTCTASDVAGNTSMVEVSYNVIYEFSGFFPPLGEPLSMHEVKAGSTVPVKFSLAGDQGLEIFVDGYPASQEVVCDTLATLGDLLEAVTPGNSGLTYSSGSDQYHFNWKTDKAWAGTCRQFVVRFTDGREYVVYFTFK